MMLRVTCLCLVPVAAACVAPMSQAQIEEANRQRVARLCQDPNYAYESGYNDGLDRRRLDTSWADSCAPEAREHVRASYQQGFHQGIANAPAQPARSSVMTCTFSSDCYDGQSCRADASGTNVCMGRGDAGDPCWFSSDCLSGSCDGMAKLCR